MTDVELMALIADGRTELMIELIARPGWVALAEAQGIGPLSWCVYYDDLTALKLAETAAGGLPGLDLNHELNSAAFFGHWKICEFLISRGAEVNHGHADTGETALHNALCKAGRPWYGHTVRLLLDKGADPNAKTVPKAETGAFMRDVHTRGETPLHRAAAFADSETIGLLLDHGADKESCDAHGDTPLSWASWHLRPGAVLQLLAYGPHKISDKHVAANTSDHGAGWGNAMERSTFGPYRPLE